MIIALVTDCSDVAENEIRGMLYKAAKMKGVDFKELIIEPVAVVKNFSLLHANFIIRLLAEDFPTPFIIYCVVNPIKEQPERIIGVTNNDIIFVGRNTGVFSWLVEDFGLKSLYKIPEERYVPFGGKYIYPSYIIDIVKYNGDLLRIKEEVGLEELEKSKLKKLNIDEGMIVHIDNFGVPKIKYSPDVFEKLGVKEGDLVKLTLPEGRIIYPKYVKRVMSWNDCELVIYNGSSFGLPEIAFVRNGMTSQILNLKIGDKIKVEKV